MLFVTWIEHRRTREICAALSMELVELVTRKRGLARYAELVPRTIANLRERKPRTLLVQSPSLVLALLCLMLRPALGHRLVVDAHNEAVIPYKNKSRLIRWLTDLVNRRADLVIVTNRQLADHITKLGTRCVVLPDRMPQAPALPPAGRPAAADVFDVAVIATYAADEPVEAIFEAAREAGDPFRFHVTGNPAKLDARVRALAPPNVRFTGFLEDTDFWSLLRDCDVVMDLTLADNCLVCGAYEALAVGTPLILSGNAASRELFAESACHVDNTPRAIAAALRDVRERHQQLRANVLTVRERMTAQWQVQASTLLVEIGRLQVGTAGHAT